MLIGATPLREVAERLGISTKSIYTWQRLFSRPAKVIEEVDAQADEIRRLKRDLARVTEERDILKKAVVGSTGQRNGSFKGTVAATASRRPSPDRIRLNPVMPCPLSHRMRRSGHAPRPLDGWGESYPWPEPW